MLKQWLGGYCVFLVGMAFGAAAQSDCNFLAQLQREPDPVSVAYVYDGDTVRLRDGRKVRLLGINTPEMGRGGKPDQRLAVQARTWVREWLNSRPEVYVWLDQQKHDHYGRLLGHIADDQGNVLGRSLLEQKLAFPIAVPPNIAAARCFFPLAARFHTANEGVWAEYPAIDVKFLLPGAQGFMRLRGLVSRVTRARNQDYWMELEGRVALHITVADQSYFAPATQFEALVGQSIEVSGWLQDRSSQTATMAKGYAPWRLQVRTPFALTVLRAAK